MSVRERAAGTHSRLLTLFPLAPIPPGAVYTLSPGCPIQIELAPTESLYLKVWVGTGEVLKYAWTTSQPYVLFYDWFLIPFYHEHEGGADNWNAYNYYVSRPK
jgi:hypothetical protein